MQIFREKRAFTLIELLVVIAIIGILAAIVLVSLRSARDSAYDAEIKSELEQVRAAAEVEYSKATGGSYAGFTIPADLVPPSCSADASYQLATSADGQDYAAWAGLCTDTDNWCVDATGISIATSGDPTAASPTCK